MSSNPLTTILNAKEDLYTVYDKLFSARTEWEKIGMGLEINPDTLAAIDMDCPANCDKAFYRMLKVWFDMLEKPTWEKLCRCLRKETVMRNSLAAEIEKGIYLHIIFCSLTACLIMIRPLHVAPFIPCRRDDKVNKFRHVYIHARTVVKHGVQFVHMCENQCRTSQRF